MQPFEKDTYTDQQTLTAFNAVLCDDAAESLCNALGWEDGEERAELKRRVYDYMDRAVKPSTKRLNTWGQVWDRWRSALYGRRSSTIHAAELNKIIDSVAAHLLEAGG